MIKPNLRNIITAITLLWVLNRSAFTHGQNLTAGSRENALGGAATTLTGPFAAFRNQGLLTAIPAATIANYYNRPYRISKFSKKAAALLFPTPAANVAITLPQSGIPGYSENYYGVVLSKSSGVMVSAGRQFNDDKSLGLTPSVSLIVNT